MARLALRAGEATLAVLAWLASAGVPAQAAEGGAALPLLDRSSHALSPRSKLELSVRETGPTLDLASGTTRYALLRLPDYTAPYEVRVGSFCDCFGFKKTMFVPAAHVLDEDFRITRSFPEEVFATRTPKVRFGSSEQYPRPEISIAVGEDNGRDRYVLVYTDARRVGEVYETSEGPAAPFRTGRVSGEVALKSRITRAGAGTLRVEVKPIRR